MFGFEGPMPLPRMLTLSQLPTGIRPALELPVDGGTMLQGSPGVFFFSPERERERERIEREERDT